MDKKNIKILMGLIAGLIISVGYFQYANSAVQTFGLATASKTIIIDPGHGGFDPGKTGTTGVHEKEINLNIALKLRDYLEQSGAYVIMTRTEDVDLDGDDTKQRKKADMMNRSQRVNDSNGDIMVSIHQNSFPQAKVRGGQVFFYKDSGNGQVLAQHIQKAIQTHADEENKRVAKHNGDYYILRTTKIPAVIVECGFLTNLEEERKLNTDQYQEKMAWAIYIGIIEYFQELKSYQ
ncbi:MAG TPA: N-acetylmuramoyl-L-alanine amidase CwlD [Epulopiscium sp.]|nr:N-acetylmuramoyl-L-alanine amidase CwlD [Candidatus Epulonipiscium sp.]